MMNSVTTVDLGSMKWCEGGPHTVKLGVGTTTVMAIRGIISPSWVARSFWMTVLSKVNGGNMYIDHPCQSCDKASTVIAWGSGIGDMNWGRWAFVNVGKHVHCWRSPCLEGLGYDFLMETPLFRYLLIWLRQAICYHIQRAWNVPGSKDYILRLKVQKKIYYY